MPVSVNVPQRHPGTVVIKNNVTYCGDTADREDRGLCPFCGGQGPNGLRSSDSSRGEWRSSDSAHTPSFTQSPSPPRSLLVRDGQTSPHRLRLVVSRSKCPPLSPSPHANIFVIGTAVINTHLRRHNPADREGVFITAEPITKLFEWGQGDSGGHVLREKTSQE